MNLTNPTDAFTKDGCEFDYKEAAKLFAESDPVDNSARLVIFLQVQVLLEAKNGFADSEKVMNLTRAIANLGDFHKAVN